MLLSSKYASNVLNTMLLQLNSSLGYMSAAKYLPRVKILHRVSLKEILKEKNVFCAPKIRNQVLSVTSEHCFTLSFQQMHSKYIYIYINNYLFLVAMLHVSTCIRHLQGVYYVR